MTSANSEGRNFQCKTKVCPQGPHNLLLRNIDFLVYEADDFFNLRRPVFFFKTELVVPSRCLERGFERGFESEQHPVLVPASESRLGQLGWFGELWRSSGALSRNEEGGAPSKVHL